MASPRSLRRNRGLQARMLCAVGMLAVGYLTFITLLAVSHVGPVAAAITVGVVVLVHYFTCDRLALAALHARPADPDGDAALYEAVRRLCAAAELPMVRLAQIPSAAPNACTVGRSPANLTLCVTTGLLSSLDPEQLDAVLAHELAHVASRDAVVMTVASVFASLAAFVVRAGQQLGARWTRADVEDSPWWAVVLLAGLLYIVSYVVFQVLSRVRELAADEGAAIITGRPRDLELALQRISTRLQELSGRELHGCCGELAAFYIVAPDLMTSTATVFATHPDLAERLKRLDRPARRPAAA